MSDYITEADTEQAEAELLRCVDLLQDWIGGECLNADTPKQWPSLSDINTDKMTTPALLAFAFDREQRDCERVYALDQLAKRFINAHQVIVRNRAENIATERVAGQEADYEDHLDRVREMRREFAA